MNWNSLFYNNRLIYIILINKLIESTSSLILASLPGTKVKQHSGNFFYRITNLVFFITII